MTTRIIQNKEVTVDDEDYHLLNGVRWQISPNGYVRGTMSKERVYLHAVIINPPVGQTVDHINGNKLDNRRSNLRICSLSQNRFNENKLMANNTNGATGVEPYGRRQFRARVKHNGVRHTIGIFNNIEDAKRAREEYVNQHNLHGLSL